MKNIIRVYFIYYDFILLNKIIFKVKNLALDKKIKYTGPVFLPSKINRFAILRSPHVNKDSRDHFQIITHKRFIDFLDVNSYFILLLKDCFFFFGLDFKFKFLLNF
ncbi:30S ribosomal subunit protein S10 [Candidatus Nasuia deltocephalinicola str. NAS-ALF]|uniref:Small ribosomal subunit protein uS10 n=1 Tax=Candidatus Nasuia deltocephalinicola str. NAS-ALF TaxID=1343077 RepID=S5SXZ5_9PROT|nr:30S ribosomal subunit protein S10 [Candidatus Nasuia deltocephalinicola str. NAS-ALF]